MNLLRCAVGVFIVLLGAISGAGATDVVCVGIRPEKASALRAAAEECQLRLRAGPATATADLPPIVVWECYESTPVSDAWAEALETYLREGGSLLVSLGRRPGTAPMRLASLLPTTGWNPASGGGENRHDRCRLSAAEEAFFSTVVDKIAVELPFYHEIRPFHAVERGQARYDCYQRPAPWVRYTNPGEAVPLLPSDANWWSRPLMNRDWQVRARGDDVRGSPLLLTGRYGAGRTAVFASSLEELPGDTTSRAFLAAVLKWLAAEPSARPSQPPMELPPIQTRVDRARRTVSATLRNPAATAADVEVVARVMTWEPCLVGDVQERVTLPAGGSSDVELRLPAAGATGYQALSDRDVYRLRLGVLSGDGRRRLGETRVDVDLREMVRLRLATQEVRSFKPGFDAPPPGMPARLGLPVMTYAAAPGQEVAATVTVENGLENLAPLARIQDESDPQNPSVKALVDGAALAERKPDWYAKDAWGWYVGPKGKDVVLTFTFADPMWLSAVTIVAAADHYRNHDRHNPGVVSVEIDGRQVALETSAGERLLANLGQLRLPFAPTRANRVRVRCSPPNDRAGSPIWLGEIELAGSVRPPHESVGGTVTVSRENAFSGESKELLVQAVNVPPLGRVEVPLTVALPASPTLGFYRLAAKLKVGAETRQTEIPLLSIQPHKPLLPMSLLQGSEIPSMGFIVTRGFRLVFDTGTGTAEDLGGWGNPDDLVWAYAHGLKQTSPRTKTEAGRLYVSENDLRHYSSPWKPFYNGEEFFDLATPRILERFKKDRRWASATQATLGFSDRWDLGPQPSTMHGWQDFEGFHAWLLDHGRPGLTGKTRKELAAEIHSRYEGLWNAWHLERYLRVLAQLREAFVRAGKRLTLYAQGTPMIAGKAADEVGRVIRGMSDDSTWGQTRESVSLTTARQMAALAFTPSLEMSTLLHWGYNSAALGNCQWRGAIGTTEPSRRHLYDRAFRGTVRRDGSYTSMHVFGYNSNAGEGFTLRSEDLDARQRVQDLHSLLTPEEPIGAGIVLSTARRVEPEHVAFDCGDAFALPEARDLAQAASRLHDAGVSVPFSANAACLERWRGTAPLVVTNLPAFSAQEIETLRRMAEKGVRLAALVGSEEIPPAAAALFGVTPSGVPAGGEKIGTLGNRPIVAHGGCLFIPVAAGELTEAHAREIAPLLVERMKIPLRLPPGTCGYGFSSNGLRFVVLEDWREEGRMAPLRIAGCDQWRALRAVEVNGHRSLKVERQGTDWVIEVPLRPGDGALVAIEVQP